MTVFWNTLRPIASAQANSRVAAQHNRYLWDQAFSSVCFVDLDLFACAVAGLRMSHAWGLPIASLVRPTRPPI